MSGGDMDAGGIVKGGGVHGGGRKRKNGGVRVEK